MTGERDASTSKMYISHVQHPVLRIFLKFLASCVLGRPNNHLTRLTDVSIVAQVTQPTSYRNELIPMAIIRHFESTVKASSPIVCGGLITLLACHFEHLDFHDTTPIHPRALLSLPFFTNAHDIAPYEGGAGRAEYQWLFHPPTTGLFILPQPGNSNIRPHRPHYCLPGAVPEPLRKYLADPRNDGREEEDEDSEREEEEEGSESENQEGSESEHEEGSESQNEGESEPADEQGNSRGPHAVPHPSPRPTTPPPHYSPSTQPTTPPTTHPMQPYELPPHQYLHEQFTRIFEGQQQIKDQLNSMTTTFQAEFESLNLRVSHLEEDTGDLIQQHHKITTDLDAIWHHHFPDPAPESTASYHPAHDSAHGPPSTWHHDRPPYLGNVAPARDWSRDASPHPPDDDFGSGAGHC